MLPVIHKSAYTEVYVYTIFTHILFLYFSFLYIYVILNALICAIIKIYVSEQQQMMILYFFFLYCCARWGYIVAFTKVLTMH
jgi:hypothetical protein